MKEKFIWILKSLFLFIIAASLLIFVSWATKTVYYKTTIIILVFLVSFLFLRKSYEMIMVNVSGKEENSFVINSKAKIKALEELVEQHYALTVTKEPQEPEDPPRPFEEVVYEINMKALEEYFKANPIKLDVPIENKVKPKKKKSKKIKEDPKREK